MSKLPITAIVLTFNEQKNIFDCLLSLQNLTDDIVIVDSGSSDKTLEIAKDFDVKIYIHPFENYSKQRNWALNNVQLNNEWIINVDADHRIMDEMVRELQEHFNKGIPNDINGFLASRRTMFLNKWIKYGGHFPVYHGMIFRRGFGQCEAKEYDQHFLIEGKTLVLESNMIDIITDSITNFTARHNNWATLEAQDALQLLNNINYIKVVKPNRKGNLMEQRRYQRLKYYSYPLFTRSFIYFIYRFFYKKGFLDGKEGLVFHILQGFWFRFLVDAKIYELKNAKRAE